MRWKNSGVALAPISLIFYLLFIYAHLEDLSAITDILTSHSALLDKACSMALVPLHDQSTRTGAGPGPLKGHASCIDLFELGPHGFIYLIFNDVK